MKATMSTQHFLGNRSDFLFEKAAVGLMSIIEMNCVEWSNDGTKLGGHERYVRTLIASLTADFPKQHFEEAACQFPG
jgi:hypothetical protein